MKKVIKMYLAVFMSVMMFFGNFSFATLGSSSARNIYLELEKANINSIKEFLDKNESLFDTDFNTCREELEIYGESLPGDFNNLKLKALGESDIKNNYYFSKVSLGSTQADKLSLEMVLKDNKVMIQIPELYEKHISVDVTKIKEICEKFEIEINEEEINEFVNMFSNAQNRNILSKQDEAYLKKVAPIYLKKLNSLIDSKYFTMNNSEKIEYDSNFIICKSVSFEITADEALNIVKVLLEDLQKDEKLLDILLFVANYFSTENITKEELRLVIDEFNQMIDLDKEELKDIKFISKLYYNTKILKRELKVASISLNEEESISLTTISNEYYELDLGEVKIRDNMAKEDKIQYHYIDIISEGIDYDYDYDTYEFVEIPYTKTESFNMVVETPDKNNTIIKFSKYDMDEKLIIKVKENVSTDKKLDCNFEFIWDTAEVDYKLFVNYLIEKM